MRLVIQRVKRASVTIDNNIVGKINQGFMVLVGLGEGDTEEDMKYCMDKMINLRVFEDEEGKMNLALKSIEGELLLISQFTLYADTRKGNRPSFIKAMHPSTAEPMFNKFVEDVRAQGIKTETGEFGADMKVELINDGPVTIIIDSEDKKKPRRD